MAETVTKTLQATLATPTTGKEQRLQRLLDTYRDALHDAYAEIVDVVDQRLGATGTYPSVYFEDPFGYTIELKSSE